MSIETVNEWRWPNFTPREMACRHCGQGYHWPEFMDKLQALRDEIGAPLRILSAHRCGIHNARVGGAPMSEHRLLAVDIALRGHDRVHLRYVAKTIGFTGFGLYHTFIHLDLGRPRFWYGPGKTVKTLWQI